MHQTPYPHSSHKIRLICCFVKRVQPFFFWPKIPLDNVRTLAYIAGMDIIITAAVVAGAYAILSSQAALELLVTLFGRRS